MNSGDDDFDSQFHELAFTIDECLPKYEGTVLQVATRAVRELAKLQKPLTDEELNTLARLTHSLPAHIQQVLLRRLET